MSEVQTKDFEAIGLHRLWHVAEQAPSGVPIPILGLIDSRTPSGFEALNLLARIDQTPQPATTKTTPVGGSTSPTAPSSAQTVSQAANPVWPQPPVAVHATAPTPGILTHPGSATPSVVPPGSWLERLLAQTASQAATPALPQPPAVAHGTVATPAILAQPASATPFATDPFMQQWMTPWSSESAHPRLMALAIGLTEEDFHDQTKISAKLRQLATWAHENPKQAAEIAGEVADAGGLLSSVATAAFPSLLKNPVVAASIVAFAVVSVGVDFVEALLQEDKINTVLKGGALVATAASGLTNIGVGTRLVSPNSIGRVVLGLSLIAKVAEGYAIFHHPSSAAPGTAPMMRVIPAPAIREAGDLKTQHKCLV